MLCVLCSVGPARFAVPADKIQEVVPRVDLRPVPEAPSMVLGLMNYRGQVLPVIDLKRQFLGQDCSNHISTRIIICRPLENSDRLVGLVAERVTETGRYRTEEFQFQGLALPQALHLGPVRADGVEMLQLLRVEQFVTPEVLRLMEPPAPLFTDLPG